VQPHHLPLLLASERFRSPDEREPLDRLRMQKGVFLLQMRGPTAWRNAFSFVPWDWGPFSHGLANTLTALQASTRLEEQAEPFRAYGDYRTTPDGEAEVADVVVRLAPEEHRFIRDVRRYVTTRSFSQLLREVYAAHPEYATRSRFRG
jgi:hypothetical protein